MRIIGRILAWATMLAMPGLAWGLAHAAWTLWIEQGTVIRVDDLVVLGAASVGAAVAGYLTLTGSAMLIGAALRGGRAIPRAVAALAPSSWQRVTATALGVTMTAGLAVPAVASSSTSPHVGWNEPATAESTATAPGSQLGAVGWVLPVVASASATDDEHRAVGFAPAPVLPTALETGPHERDAASEPVRTSADRAVHAESTKTYTVAPGDSLWRITAALLGAQASDASISEAWPKLYAANADTIGPDPALIHPGQVLSLPAGLPA